MRKIKFLFLLMLPISAGAQRQMSLDECFTLVTKNYPLSKQSVMLKDQADLDLEALNRGKLPQLEVNAQASYQSDVTQLPVQLPNATISPPNKDQYRATLDVNQSIYNGGIIDATAKARETGQKVGQQQLVVNLYGLKSRVNQLYLSLLLLQDNWALLEAKEKQLRTRLDEVQAGVKYGMLLPASATALEVEFLKIKQQFVVLRYTKTDLLRRLSLLLGEDLGDDVVLRAPEIDITSKSDAIRPELRLFELQKEQIDRSTELISKANLPKINAFAQGGYGNPGLNMLDNSFNTFYFTGLRLNWNIFDWNKTKTEKQSLQINKALIDTEKETFELNNSMELVSLQSEIDKLQETLAIDIEIVALRENILKASESQLKNGVITSSAYVLEFTNLFDAKNDLNLHRTQLLSKKIQYQLTDGSYGNPSK